MHAGLGREIGEASALLGLVAHRRGRWSELFRDEFLRSVRDTPQLAPFVFDAHLCLAEFALCGATGHERVAGDALELLHVAEDAGSVQGRGLATLVLGEAQLFSDRLVEAEHYFTTACQLHRPAGAAAGEALAIQRLAELALARGEL